MFTRNFERWNVAAGRTHVRRGLHGGVMSLTVEQGIWERKVSAVVVVPWGVPSLMATGCIAILEVCVVVFSGMAVWDNDVMLRQLLQEMLIGRGMWGDHLLKLERIRDGCCRDAVKRATRKLGVVAWLLCLKWVLNRKVALQELLRRVGMGVSMSRQVMLVAGVSELQRLL
jgi:hypothetical protein